MNSYAAASTCVRAIGRIHDLQHPLSHRRSYLYVNGEGERFMYEETRSIQRHGRAKGACGRCSRAQPLLHDHGRQERQHRHPGHDHLYGLARIMKRGCTTTNQGFIDAGIMFKADTVEGCPKRSDIRRNACRHAEEVQRRRSRRANPTSSGEAPPCMPATCSRPSKAPMPFPGDERHRSSSPSRYEKIEGPFYGMGFALGLLDSQGGAKRNGQSQVLDVAGNPIPRLYSAGELGFPSTGYMYNGGGNISEAVSTGRIAGQGCSSSRGTPSRGAHEFTIENLLHESLSGAGHGLPRLRPCVVPGVLREARDRQAAEMHPQDIAFAWSADSDCPAPTNGTCSRSTRPAWPRSMSTCKANA